MKSFDLKTVLLGGTLLAGTFVYAAAGWAQTQPADDTVVQTPKAKKEKAKDEKKDEIVVTGSRLKQDSFSSVSPLQVIDAKEERDLGLIDAAQILQTVTVAAGTQIDTSFGGFVLDNGPGAETVDLRGLGANRNLILLNGRRVAPSGIEGAPSSPDIGLLPSGLIDHYDIQLDGASAVYGSDAIAGVVNAVLRKDVEGLEIRGSGQIPEQSNGNEYNVDITYGKNNDRGYIMVGGSYQKLDEIKYQDRDFLNHCNTNLEVTTTGEVRTVDLSSSIGQRPDECKIQGLAGRIIAPLFGSIYNRGNGTGNLIIPGYSESSQFGVGFDQNQDGVTDVTFQDFAINGRDLFKTLRADLERYSIAAMGEYTLEGENNLTPYFEVIYSGRNSFQDGGAFQLFPDVPANNPFNPCNPGQPNGVDCGLAYDAMLNDPVFAQAVADTYGLTPAQFRDFGIVNLFSGPIGAQSVLPVVSVRGDRTQVKADLKQIRAVVGMRGDIPQINFGGFQNWSGEAYVSLSHSNGKAHRPGIRGDRLDFALGNNASGVPCQQAPGETVRQDVLTGCVPVNMFADSLYQGVIGDFATQAEHDYLFDSRDFETKVDQTIWNAFFQGEIAQTDAGAITLGFGGEIRVDSIDSLPDDVAAQGLFFGFFSDLGAKGQKTTKEAFAEAYIPLVADKPFFRKLDLNLSGRITKDEFYPTATTYSAKSSWQMFDSLTFKGTVGTSFRAPNLRENFLLSQTGFGTIGDPCAAPASLVVDPITGQVTGSDPRSPQTLANCRLAGIDPLTYRLGQTGFYSVEQASGGVTDLNPETSKSFSAGFAFEQPWFDGFDLTIGGTYWDIDIKNTIIEPSGSFLVSECYVNNPNLSSPFCSRITRDPATQDMTFIDAGFINRDRETARGEDFNIHYSQDINVFQRPVTISARLNATHLEERKTFQSLGNSSTVIEPFVGEFGFPDWTGLGSFRVDYDDFIFNWQTYFLGAVRADQDVIAQDVFGSVADGLSETCLGAAPDNVQCRNVNTADAYFMHSASITYRKDDWSVGIGVRNVFDKNPPRIDTGSVFGRNNVPLGGGYDLNGRRFFANVSKKF